MSYRVRLARNVFLGMRAFPEEERGRIVNWLVKALEDEPHRKGAELHIIPGYRFIVWGQYRAFFWVDRLGKATYVAALLVGAAANEDFWVQIG